MMSPSRAMRIAKWRPIEIKGLEPAADAAVRDLASGIVVAGPGAGKTELLAQRACFLFQTGICPSPYRILAISFKRDAASNLRKRVRRRCGIEAAGRFDSLTYDSFAKSILDRFFLGLPDTFRPSADYLIDVELDRAASLRPLVQRAAGVAKALADSIVANRAEEAFFRKHVVGGHIQIASSPTSPKPTENETLAREVWRVLLRGEDASRLNFTMISRLAELVLRINPKVLTALRATYRYVFLDEFQDTTQIQYDLTTTAFKGSSARLTAVGDSKQRIMLWAGALTGVFDEFKADFDAKHHRLEMNYRSAPALVRIQQHLIQSLEPSAKQSIAHRKAEDGEGECRIFSYPNDTTEAEHLAEYLSDLIREDGLRPSDICVLTRTWNDKYSSLLIERLANRGVAARSEREIQDLLAEPIVSDVLSLVRLAVAARAPQAWADMTYLCMELWGIDDGVKASTVERRLAEVVKLVGKMIKLNDGSETQVTSLLNEVVDFLGKNAIKQTYPQYRQGMYLNDTISHVAREIHLRLASRMSWAEALDDLEGANCIPIMTVHKSKGLEYDTVVFVGLEDSTLWNFRNSPDEEKCGFFVAFSRAIKRVIFTFSALRPKSVGGRPEKQSRTSIGSLYSLLEQAGVKPEPIVKR